MKKINNWKTLAFATIVPLLLAANPIVTFACDATVSHCGG